MRNILIKEMKLSASVLTYLFIAFGLMFFLPGYPVLCGAFFVSFGIFQSFQNSREANDIVYSALLPVSKKKVVLGKYLFASFIELCGFTLMLIATLIRMTVLADAVAYRTNTLMNANFFALGVALLIFGLFNLCFIGGFFRTAYKFAGPFIVSITVIMLVIGVAETLHHLPALEALNSFGFDNIGLQSVLLASGFVLWLILTYISYKISCRNFEKIDL